MITPTRAAEAEPFKAVLVAILADERRRLGITTYELAKRSGLNDMTLRSIVAGDVIPRMDTVFKLEDGLGRPPGWLSEEIGRLLTPRSPDAGHAG